MIDRTLLLEVTVQKLGHSSKIGNHRQIIDYVIALDGPVQSARGAQTTISMQLTKGEYSPKDWSWAAECPTPSAIWRRITVKFVAN